MPTQPDRPNRPSRKAVIVGVVVAGTLGLGACGSSGHTTTATTVPATTVPATTVPATTAAPTTAAPTTSPLTSPPATVPAPTSTIPDEATYRADYVRIIDGSKASTTGFADAVENLEKGTITQATFAREAQPYVEASEKLQRQFLAIAWPADLEPLVQQLVVGDRKIVAAVQQISVVPKADVKTAINALLATGSAESPIAEKIRVIVGLPKKS
jgi:hypothetical protein